MRRACKYFALSLLGFVSLIAILYFCYPTQVSSGKIVRYNPNNIPTQHILLGQEHIIWDTGSEYSIFFQNFASCKIWIWPITMKDANSQSSTTILYYSPSMSFDSVTIKHVHYTLVQEDKVAKVLRNRGVMGIIGMNVISKANWLINCKDSTLQIMAQDEVYDTTAVPALSLSYKKRRTPNISLIVAGITIDDVLVDSGSEVSDLTLLKEDIAQIHRRIIPVDTIISAFASLYNDSIPEQLYTYHNITINGHTFDSLEIRQSNVYRSIGTGFFNKFSKVYLNTKEKVFRFY